MERGFLLLLGSIVALAIVASVGAQLDPGYQEGREEQQLQQQEPQGFQYLPGESGRRRNGRRKNGSRRAGSRYRGSVQEPSTGEFSLPSAQGGSDHSPHLPPALPQQFTGSYDGDSGAAPGEPGIDYPIYSHIPVTSFSCEGKIAGYYADPETQCQIFHVCTPGGATSNSFICPNGTLFNPAVRTCDWWPAVDCGSSSESLRLNYVEKRVKDKTQATQSLLGGPGTRIKPQRTQHRQQNQGFRQKVTNEISSQNTYQETGGQSINFDRREQISRDKTASLPTQPPQTTRGEQFTQDNRQEYNTVMNGGRNTANRRRPGSKRFPNQSSKRNQYVRTTTPPAFTVGSQAVEETYSSQSTTQRAPANGNFNWPHRSQTVTRFDITSETLDFPSFRNTPSTTTYRTPTSQIIEEPTSPIVKDPTTNRVSRPKPHRQPLPTQYSVTPQYTSTANGETSTEEKERKTTRIVTQTPSVNIPQIKVQPINVKFRQPPNLRVSFAANEPTQPSLLPTHSTVEFPIIVTTPKVEHFSASSVTSEQPLENSIFQNSPTFATYAENQRPLRPIVVASPKPDISSFAPQKKLFPSGFMTPNPILESFEPLSSSEEALPLQYNSADNVDTPETRGGLSSSGAASFAQSIAGSTADQGASPAGGASIAQAFAQSGAFSGDLQFSGRDDFPFFSGQADGDGPDLAGLKEPQNSGRDDTNLAPENTGSGPFSSSFAQSFASANSFSSDEGFQQNTPASTAAPSTHPPKATTFRPLNLVTVKSTSRPTTTTIKPVYTPTVPQTTARPATRPPPKLVTSTTTTARPSTAVPAPSTTTVRTPSTQRPVDSTSTTKKPKGFYITLAPPTRPGTVQQPLEKDKAPKDNSLSYPSDSYFPNPTQSPITPLFSPSLFYPPTRPSYVGVPNSYFRSATRTQYSPGNTGHLSSTIKTSDTTFDSDAALDIIDAPVKSTSFEIETVPDIYRGSGFTLNSPDAFDYQSQVSFDYQPNQFNQKNETEQQQRTNSNQILQGTTEPPFVIQKSVELFASHEVAYHPSVFSQSSYSLSSTQGDYTAGKDDQIDFQPPPYIEPSPNARGFGNWNLDDTEEKRTSEKSQ